MVWETIFSRAWKSESESWSGGYKQFGELFVLSLENKKASYGQGDTNSLGNCSYPSLETRKRGQFGVVQKVRGTF